MPLSVQDKFRIGSGARHIVQPKVGNRSRLLAGVVIGNMENGRTIIFCSFGGRAETQRTVAFSVFDHVGLHADVRAADQFCQPVVNIPVRFAFPYIILELVI